jgi:flavin reductase (DIM6/NTAB) family NADH-FMN oxidoreductase RutF
MKLLNPNNMKEQEIYNFMMSSILPRPISWISTVSEEGVPNLAPFSYFMGVCSIPMTVMFCPKVGPEGRVKNDTLRNLEQIPEFVVHVVNTSNVQLANQTGEALPYGVSEFERCGVTAIPSVNVRPPRVLESPIALECSVKDIITISDQPGGGWIVLGNVELIHVKETLLDQDGFRVNLEHLSPVARLGGRDFLRSTDIFELERLV